MMPSLLNRLQDKIREQLKLSGQEETCGGFPFFEDEIFQELYELEDDAECLRSLDEDLLNYAIALQGEIDGVKQDPEPSKPYTMEEQQSFTLCLHAIKDGAKEFEKWKRHWNFLLDSWAESAIERASIDDQKQKTIPNNS